MRTKSPHENIPSFDNLYDVTRDYVKEHQGEKGYIDTDSYNKENEATYGNDTIYGMEYCEKSNIGEERIVYAVRVKDDELQVLMRPWMRTYNNAPTEDELANDDNWDSVRSGVNCYYLPTIINIADCIEQYA